MNIYEAISKRKSVRNFADLEIEADLINRIKQALDLSGKLYPETDVFIVMSDYCKKSFHAPYYIGIYTNGEYKSLINAGYILHQVVIYLTAIGIATCYQGKSFVFKEQDMEGRKLAISCALGYPLNNMYRNPKEINRLKLTQLCTYKEKPNSEIESLLNIARISPSSYNSQPWRFVVYNNRVHVFMRRGIIKKLQNYGYINMGILLANVGMYADETWIDIIVREIDDIKEKKLKDYIYITSIFNKNTSGHRLW